MRLGVLKKIIDEATDDNIQLIFEVESVFSGHFYHISGYNTLITALEALADQPWLETNAEILEDITKAYGKTATEAQISQEHFGELSQIVNEINQELPVFYGILEVLVDEQDEHIVNIKIPADSISDLDELSKFNKELQEVLKLIVKHKGLGGDIEFKGFDTGSSWYEILITGGPIVYFALMGVIVIAEGMLQVQKLWYENQEIRLSLEAEKRKQAKEGEAPKPVTDDEIKRRVNEMVEIKIEEQVDQLIAELSELPNGPEEMKISITKGLEKLIALIEKGTEIHPSLNPPEFIKQDDEQRFSIDYERLKKLLEKKEKPPQIENQSDKDEDDASDSPSDEEE